MWHLTLLFLGATAIAGCSIHPLPEDVTGDPTFAIVQKIRCEARGAIFAHALVSPLDEAEVERIGREAEANYAKILANFPVDEDKAKAKKLRNFKKSLEKNKKLWIAQLASAEVDKKLQEDLRDAAIGYDFKLTMTETSGASGAGTFTFPFGNGKFLLGVTAGEDKERKNDRSFQIVESFPELIADRKLMGCEKGSTDWKYPITGSVGIDEIMKTYTQLQGIGPGFGRQPPAKRRTGGQGGERQEQDRPGGGNDAGLVAGSGAIAFTEELTFTTSYGGGLEPSLELNPVLHDFRLTKASASLGATRKDTHKMTITIARSYEGVPGDMRTLVESITRGGRRLPVTYNPTWSMQSQEPRPVSRVDDYIRLFEALSGAEKAKGRALFQLDRQRYDSDQQKILDAIEDR